MRRRVLLGSLLQAPLLASRAAAASASPLVTCSTRVARVGQSVRVSWSLENVSRPTRPGDVLLLALPANVRVAGTGFVPAPPSVDLGPGLGSDPQRFRVVIPLGVLRPVRKGAVVLRFFAPGDVSIEWRHLSSSARSEPPHEGSLALKVADAEPRIAIADAGAMAQLQPQTQLSGSRRYLVNAYPGWFELVEKNTEGKLIQLAGEAPAFSPTSRFITFVSNAAIQGDDLRVLDVTSGELLGQIYDVERFAWLEQDSILAVVGAGGNDPRVVLPHIDPLQQLSFRDSLGCGPCGGEAYVAVDRSRHAAAMKVGSGEFASLGLLRVRGELSRTYGARGDYEAHSVVLSQRSSGPSSASGAASPAVAPASPPPPAPRLDHAELAAAVRGGAAFSRPRLDRAAFGSGTDALVRRLADYGLRFAENVPVVTARVNVGDPSYLSLIDLVGGYLPRARKVLAPGPAVGPCAPDHCTALRYWVWQPDGGPKSGLVQEFCGKSDDPQDSYGAQLDLFAGSRLVRYKGGSPPWPGEVTFADSLNGALRSPADRVVRPVRWPDTPGTESATASTGDAPATSNPDPLAKPDCEGVLSRLLAVNSDPRRWGVSAYLTTTGFILLASLGSTVINFLKADTGNLAGVVINNAKDLALVIDLRVSDDGRLLLQHNADGQFHLYDLVRQAAGSQVIGERERIVSGAYIDDEIVLYTDSGLYDGTLEGTYYVRWDFPGREESYDFSQFASLFRAPMAIKEVLTTGSTTAKAPRVEAPPNLELTLTELDAGRATVNGKIDVRSSRPLKEARIYVDGVRSLVLPLTGESSSVKSEIPLGGGTQWVTAVAYDDVGFSSTPKSAMVTVPYDASHKRGRLNAVCVGVNTYPAGSGIDLHFAEQDAEQLQSALAEAADRLYDHASVRLLTSKTSPNASGENILEAIRQAVAVAEPRDALLLYMSGHGAQGRSGDFFFLPAEATFETVETRGLRWADVAAVLGRSRARTLVLLDACRSGAAGEFFAANDAYARELAQSGNPGMVVLAASKGRQSSLESAEFGGGHGAFNVALVDAIGKRRAEADTNDNGTIEVEELRAFVRDEVMTMTNGAQSPWLTRAEIVGPIAFF